MWKEFIWKKIYFLCQYQPSCFNLSCFNRRWAQYVSKLGKVGRGRCKQNSPTFISPLSFFLICGWEPSQRKSLESLVMHSPYSIFPLSSRLSFFLFLSLCFFPPSTLSLPLPPSYLYYWLDRQHSKTQRRWFLPPNWCLEFFLFR